MQDATTTIGIAVDNIPTLIPPIIKVAEPVSDVAESFLVGLYVSDVKYSVDYPISTPERSPAKIAK